MIYGFLTAEVYWIRLDHVYDITRERIPIGKVKKLRFSIWEDPEIIDNTIYEHEDWRANKERKKSSDDAKLKITVQMEGET